jgi:predicted Zn-dependent protease
MNKLFLAVFPVLALSACASPESRVRAGLINAGISTPVATCMAKRMTDRLSLDQLRRLQSISTLRDERIGQMTMSQFLHKIRALDDPEIVSVVTSAGIRCAITS